MLDKNPYDQVGVFALTLKAAWLLKCRALTKKAWIDDLEIDEEGVGDILMGKFFYCHHLNTRLDENAMSNAPRPGTSFQRPHTGSQ